MAPVVITLVTDGSRCLLARQSSFPKGLYSALAGFCDIGKEGREEVQATGEDATHLSCAILLESQTVILMSRKLSWNHASFPT